MSESAETLPAGTPRLLFAGVDADIGETLSATLGSGVEVVVVGSLEAATVALGAVPFDAALVQPRLATGSGNALLGLLKRDHPRIVRYLVLEDGRDGLALAALDNLHRVLQAPIDAPAFLVGLHALRALRQRLEHPRLAEAIGGIGRLPPPPALSLELMRRTDAADATAGEVAALVERDPVLAAKVLRLCNSAMYSAGQRIEDIQGAVLRLGHLTLRRLVMAGEVFGGNRPSDDVAAHETLRDQSLRASRFAARLAPEPWADLAATAALLAGVGRLLPGVRRPWQASPDAAVAVGAEAPTYAEAGAYLLGLWGLPERLVDAAAHHVAPESAGETGLGLVGLCHVAWAMVADVPLDVAWVAAHGLEAQRPVWERMAAERVADEVHDVGEA